jgi:hypothetical protein
MIYSGPMLGEQAEDWSDVRPLPLLVNASISSSVAPGRGLVICSSAPRYGRPTRNWQQRRPSNMITVAAENTA